MTVGEWLHMAERRLEAAGVSSPKLEASLLAAHVLLVDRSWLFAHPESEFNELAGESALSRREGREPLAYILGYREFYGRRFTVSSSVLIPRQETEILVETAIKYAKPNAKLLDVGTGSGCIAITAKLERPDLQVTAVDISEAALEVAQQNAEDLNADIRFLNSDCFTALTGEWFDLIVSNPPYIGREEPLMPEVSDYEPSLALFADDHGTAFLKQLAKEGKSYLADGGILMSEIGYQQLDRTRTIFEEQEWTFLESAKDIAGHDRVTLFSGCDRLKR
jgi:release factor glutamine methyltransferase